MKAGKEEPSYKKITLENLSATEYVEDLCGCPHFPQGEC
jgi:hypothetical protein